MTVLWYIARGILFERGGFDLCAVQGNSVQGHKLRVVLYSNLEMEEEKMVR